MDSLRQAVSRIEHDLYQDFDEEVPSDGIGERVMRELQNLDSVAYVRFASVYRKFDTVDEFADIVQALQERREQPSQVG